MRRRVGRDPRRDGAGALAQHRLAAQQQGAGHSRLFPPSDLGLLDAPDRDLWQRPDLIMDSMGIADGSVVADIGAGSGWFTIRLARRVGPQGLVYAEDVQQEMINAISRRVSREGFNNVKAVLGTINDPKLPRAITRRGVDGRLVPRSRGRAIARRCSPTWRRRSSPRAGWASWISGWTAPAPALRLRSASVPTWC